MANIINYDDKTIQADVNGTLMTIARDQAPPDLLAQVQRMEGLNPATVEGDRPSGFGGFTRDNESKPLHANFPTQEADSYIVPDSGVMAGQERPWSGGVQPAPQAPSVPTIQGQPQPTQREAGFANPAGISPDQMMGQSSKVGFSGPSDQYDPMGMYEKGKNEYLKGAQGLADVMQKQGDESASIIDTKLKEHSQAVNEYTNKVNFINEQFEDHTKRQSDLMNQWREMKVDPSRFWKDKSAGQKAMAGIAIAMGAIGDAMMQIGGTKGPGNQALAIIMDQIDKDVQAQETEIEKFGQGIQIENNQVMQAMQMGMNKEQAKLMAANQKLEQVNTYLAGIEAKYAGQKQAEMAAQMKGELSMKQAEIAATLTKVNAEFATKQASQMGKLMVNLPDGSVAYAKSEKDAEAMTDIASMHQNLSSQIDSYKNMAKELRVDERGNPLGSWLDEDIKGAKAARERIIQDLIEFDKAYSTKGARGGFTNLSYKQASKLVPDVTNLIRSDEKVWNNLYDSIESRLMSNVNNRLLPQYRGSSFKTTSSKLSK